MGRSPLGDDPGSRLVPHARGPADRLPEPRDRALSDGSRPGHSEESFDCARDKLRDEKLQPWRDGSHFDRAERFVHWGHALLFLSLVGTGALMLWGHPSLRAVALGPYRALPLVHTGIGAAFLLLPLLPGLVGRGASLARDLTEFVRWRTGDVAWLLLAPASIVLRHLPLPPQGRFNAGQRLNALFTIASAIVVGATGILIWLGRAVPYRIQEPAYELHVLVAALAVLVFLGHLVMALAHPASLRAMLTGRPREPSTAPPVFLR